jgi:hypothetical protein
MPANNFPMAPSTAIPPRPAVTRPYWLPENIRQQIANIGRPAILRLEGPPLQQLISTETLEPIDADTDDESEETRTNILTDPPTAAFASFAGEPRTPPIDDDPVPPPYNEADFNWFALHVECQAPYIGRIRQSHAIREFGSTFKDFPILVHTDDIETFIRATNTYYGLGVIFTKYDERFSETTTLVFNHMVQRILPLLGPITAASDSIDITLPDGRTFHLSTRKRDTWMIFEKRSRRFPCNDVTLYLSGVTSHFIPRLFQRPVGNTAPYSVSRLLLRGHIREGIATFLAAKSLIYALTPMRFDDCTIFARSTPMADEYHQNAMLPQLERASVVLQGIYFQQDPAITMFREEFRVGEQVQDGWKYQTAMYNVSRMIRPIHANLNNANPDELVEFNIPRIPVPDFW